MASVTAAHDSYAIACALLTALSNGVAVTTQHIASTSSPSGLRGWRFLSYLSRHPLWLLGWLGMGGSLLFQALALHFAAMSLVQPLLVSELILGLLLRRWWLGQVVSARAWAAAGVTALALAAFLVTITGSSPTAGTPPSWVVPSAGSVIVALVLVAGGLRGSPGRRAALLGSATAVVWALEAAFIKECTLVISQQGYGGLVTSWSFYAFVVCGVGGLVCEQSALHVGPLRNSQTAIVVADPVVSVVLGAWIFHERLGSSLWGQAGAVLALGAALVGAGILIAATPETMGRVGPAAV